MNKVILMGRLTRDPEIRRTQGNNPMCIANFTVAVDRRGRGREGDPTADFIPCVVFGKAAEHVEKYYRKGLKTCLSGRIQTRNYTNKEGVKVYVTEVIVEDLEFAESKNASGGGQPQGGYQQQGYPPQGNGYQQAPPQGGYGGQPQGGYQQQGYPPQGNGYQQAPPQGGYGGQPQGGYQQGGYQQPQGGSLDGFMNIPDGIDEELPFT